MMEYVWSTIDFFSNVFVCFVLFQTEETDRKAN